MEKNKAVSVFGVAAYILLVQQHAGRTNVNT